MKNKELDNMLDQVTAGIRSERVDEQLVGEAAERVWMRMASEPSAGQLNAAEAAGAAVSDHIEGCGDFQSLIPAYLNGKLSEARALLLVDHTHECIPCRRAMKQAREARVETAVPVRRKQPKKTGTYNLRPVVLRWGIAAALLVGLGLVALPLVQRYVGTVEATVQAAEGPLYLVADSKTRALNAGEKIGRGDVIRTAKDGHAIVRLDDGSIIEMKDRSELSIRRTLSGTTLHLDGGSVIIEAAQQKAKRRTVVGKLVKEVRKFFGLQQARDCFVETNDSLGSVTGTTCAVNAGTKGSRVSVIEGEVHLDRNGGDKVIRAGEQATTSPAIDTIPVKDEVAWSRNATRYASVLNGLATLKNELKTVQQPGVRSSTHLLDLMPENTVVYAALPNLANSIVESHRIIQERMSQNAALREWWEKEQSGRRQNMDQVIETIRQFGSYLGDEIAVSVTMDEQGRPGEPLVLAELKNSEGFRPFLEQEIAKYSGDRKGGPEIQFIENPAAATADANDKQEKLYVWIQHNLLAASPKLQQLQNLAVAMSSGGASSFTATPFRNRIAQVYQEGAGLVVAANLEKIVAQTKPDRTNGPEAEKRENALNQLGILSVKYFVLDQ